MGGLNLFRQQSRELTKIRKKQSKDLKKISSVKIKGLISKEGRVRIPAKRRHEVEDKYKNKCAVRNCPIKRWLQIHHKNGINSDNALRNLELLCPTHHYAKHEKGSKLNKKIRARSKRKRSIFGF